jgi:hypothetical protein
MWRASETQLALGREVPLQRFVEEHRRESDERIARRLARTLQIALHREERIVLGPTLCASPAPTGGQRDHGRQEFYADDAFDGIGVPVSSRR